MGAGSRRLFSLAIALHGTLPYAPVHVHHRQRLLELPRRRRPRLFINLPLINYYEHGTYLTVGHAHAAMFGAFGFLALGMAAYMLRIATKPAAWTERRLRWSFWLWNVGLAVMVFVSVLPVGFLQLETAFTQSYAAARSLAFYNSDLVQLLFWARLPGDTLIILGTLLFGYDMVRKRFTLRSVSMPSDAPAAGTIPDRVMAEDDD